MSLLLITIKTPAHIPTCGVIDCTYLYKCTYIPTSCMYLKVQVQVHSHFNWWRNNNPLAPVVKPPTSRSFVRSFVHSTRQKFFSVFSSPLLSSSLLLFSSGSSNKKVPKSTLHVYAEIGFVPYPSCGDVHDLLGTAELSPKEMCGEDASDDLRIVVFTEYNQSRVWST